MIERSIRTSTHGRYLVEPGLASGSPLLVGFHGYAESADTHLTRLMGIPGIERWTVVSVQGLHRFYRGRSNDVVASWMTRQDREQLIADNRDYVMSVVADVRREWAASQLTAYSGFSQGVATAFRAAAWTGGAAAVIACGGDVPPELSGDVLGSVRRVLIGRGVRDEWYTAAKLAADRDRLDDAAVMVETVSLDAGHEWTTEFSAAAGAFLATLPH